MIGQEHHFRFLVKDCPPKIDQFGAILDQKSPKLTSGGSAALWEKALSSSYLATHEDKYDFKSENVIELLKQLELKLRMTSLQALRQRQTPSTRTT